MAWSVRTFSLVKKYSDPGLFCAKDKLTLGGLSLLNKTEFGFKPRPIEELQQIFDAAYGFASDIDVKSYLKCLQSIADALESQNVARATMLSLMLRLPSIDPKGMLRLCKLSSTNLTKYNDHQPRDWRGRWTNGDAQSPNKSRQQSLSPNFTLGGRTQPIVADLIGSSPDRHLGNPNLVTTQAIPFPLFPPPLIGGGVAAGSPKPKDDDVYPRPYPQTGAGQISTDSATAGARAIPIRISEPVQIQLLRPIPKIEPLASFSTKLKLADFHSVWESS